MSFPLENTREYDERDNEEVKRRDKMVKKESSEW
jgi:hypothetical protein